MAKAFRHEVVERLLISLFAAFITAMVWNWTVVCSVANAADSATYEWTDERGTVTFTDNPMTIPDNHTNQVKQRESVKGEPSRGQYGQDSSLTSKQSPQEEEIYGGHDKRWWQGQFSGTRAELEKTKADRESRQQDLKTLHYRKVVSNSAQTDGIFGSPRRNREMYREASEEIRAYEKRIKVLEQKLIELENEAARYGVPFEWRR
jgi:hypothetical protein